MKRLLFNKFKATMTAENMPKSKTKRKPKKKIVRFHFLRKPMFFVPIFILSVSALLTTVILCRQNKIYNLRDKAASLKTVPAAGLVFGANIVNDNIDLNQVRDSGVTASVMWLYLPEFVDRGTNKLDSAKALQAVEKFSSDRGGLSVSPHVMPQTREEAQASGGFHLPDLNTYKPQLADLVRALKGRVSSYSIANEVPFLWGDTIESYGQLLQASYTTIKAADPNATVLDSGLASHHIGLIITNALYKQGKTQEAIAFINNYFNQNHFGLGGAQALFPIDSEAKLSGILNAFPRPITMGERLLGNFCPYYDVFELHYYQEWEYLPATLEWIKSQMADKGCVKPIQTWEVGYGLDDSIKYDPASHADSVLKELTLAASAGSFINYSVFYDQSGAGVAQGLYTKEGKARPAAKSFSVSVNKLKGATFVAKVDLGQDVWAYKFTKNGKEIYTLWGTSEKEIKLPVKSARVLVTFVDGLTKEENSNKLSISLSPVVVETILDPS